jgi:hypothetical protein
MSLPRLSTGLPSWPPAVTCGSMRAQVVAFQTAEKKP